MREDIATAVTECYRYDRWGPEHNAFRAAKRILLDEDGDVRDDIFRSKMGIKGRKIGSGTKEFDDNLGPIYGFLRKSVGRQWDKVYAEVKARLPGTSTLQQHVLDHLHSQVYQRCWYEGENLMATGHQGYSSGQIICIAGPDSTDTRYHRHQYYVCPKTGQLKNLPQNKSWRELNRATDDITIKTVLVDKNFGFALRNSIWVRIKFVQLDPMKDTLIQLKKLLTREQQAKFLGITYPSSAEDALGNYQGRGYSHRIFVTEFSTANSVEIKRHRLRQFEGNAPGASAPFLSFSSFDFAG